MKHIKGKNREKVNFATDILSIPFSKTLIQKIASHYTMIYEYKIGVVQYFQPCSHLSVVINNCNSI